MKKLKYIFTILAFSFHLFAYAQKYQEKTVNENSFSYSAVTNDPLKTRIYTLKNGLRVYLSVYKDAPRIQTYIAVRA